MIKTRFQEQAGHNGAPALHLGIAEARIVRLMDLAQMRRQIESAARTLAHIATLRGWAWQIHFVR